MGKDNHICEKIPIVNELATFLEHMPEDFDKKFSIHGLMMQYFIAHSFDNWEPIIENVFSNNGSDVVEHLANSFNPSDKCQKCVEKTVIEIMDSIHFDNIEVIKGKNGRFSLSIGQSRDVTFPAQTLGSRVEKHEFMFKDTDKKGKLLGFVISNMKPGLVDSLLRENDVMGFFSIPYTESKKMIQFIKQKSNSNITSELISLLKFSDFSKLPHFQQKGTIQFKHSSSLKSQIRLFTLPRSPVNQKKLAEELKSTAMQEILQAENITFPGLVDEDESLQCGLERKILANSETPVSKLVDALINARNVKKIRAEKKSQLPEQKANFSIDIIYGLAASRAALINTADKSAILSSKQNNVLKSYRVDPEMSEEKMKIVAETFLRDIEILEKYQVKN